MRGGNIKAFRTVALAGAPGAGKTTVFEEITGCFVCEKRRELLKGYYYYKYCEYEIMRLPDTYSEEDAARDFDCVVYVLNAEKTRNELLGALRCSRSAKRFILLLNFCDRAKKRKIPLNVKLLSALLRAPVIKATANSGKGINSLLEAVRKSFKN